MKKYLLLSIFCFLLSNVFSQVVETRLLGTEDDQDLFGNNLTVTPDGKYMAISRTGLGTSTFVLVYRFNGFEYDFADAFKMKFEVSSLKFSDNGKRLAVVTGGGNIFRLGEVFIYESNSQDLYKQIGNSIQEEIASESFANSFDFSSDGSTFIVSNFSSSGNTGEVRAYNYVGNTWVKKGEFLKGTATGQNFGSNVTISGDGNRIAISSFNLQNPKLEIFDFVNGIWTPSTQGKLNLQASEIALSKDGNLLVVGYTNFSKIKFYEFKNNAWTKINTEITSHQDQRWNSISIDITSDKKNIIIGSLNGDTQKTKVEVIDVINNQYFARSGDFYRAPKDDYFGIQSEIVDGGSKIIVSQPQFNKLQGQVLIIADEAKTYTYLNSFIDFNKNKIKDGNEKFIDNAQFLLNDAVELVGFQNDGVYANVAAGQHTFKPILPSYLKVNGPEIISFTSVSNKIDSIFVPLVFSEDVYKLSVFHNSEIPICNENGSYEIFLSNVGNNDLKVVSEITFDQKMEVIPPTDAKEVTKNYVKWENTISYEGRTSLKIKVKMPDETNTGSLLSIKFKAYIYDAFGVFKDSVILDLSSILRCGFDPNDKAATPEGVGNARLTLKKDYIQYKIRFQNTGNFPTKNIAIQDDLDPGFDWKTFEVLAASHPLTRTEKREGKVRFIFANINLPDSASNEELSNGYVIYRIKPKSNVAENTIVKNKADIYFDLNKPIETNTTINTLVTSFPTSVNDQNYNLGLDIYPNPATSNFFINTEVNDKNANLNIYDIYGKLLWSEKYYKGLNVSTKDLNSGFYLLKIEQNHKVLGIGRLLVVK